jgi:sugar/nucleoside kinase (ribokinase family)
VRRFDLVVLGDANPDLVLTGDVEPAFGQAERLVDDARLTIGGSGAIVACGAARLGLRVALCAMIGDDLFGRWIRDEIRKRHVDVDRLLPHPDLPTGITVVLSTTRGDRAILTSPGTIPMLEGESIDRELFGSARHVHVSSYFLQRALARDLPHLLDKAHELGATTSVDPNWDPEESWDGDLDRVLARTDIFLPNETEALRIAGTDDLDEGVKGLARSARLVVAKMGPDGAVACDRSGLTRAPGLAATVLDTTGAGDSFDAGFLASWLAGDSLARSLAMGNVCGALSTGALGGVEGQPTMDEAVASLAVAPPVVPG